MIELDSDHRYWELRDGKKREVPGVSHILEAMGEKGSYYRKNTDFYMTRGTYAHKAAALDHAGELDESTVDPEIKGYLQAVRNFKREHMVTVLASEKSIYHEGLDYCGTLDLVAVIARYSYPFVLDLKSGSPAPWHILQVAAYLLAHGRKEWKKFGAALVYLKQTGRYTLDIIPPMVLDRQIAKWENLVREFHQKESKIWE